MSFTWPFVSRRRYDLLQRQLVDEKVTNVRAIVQLVDWQDQVARLQVQVQVLNTALKLSKTVAAQGLQRTQRIPDLPK